MQGGLSILFVGYILGQVPSNLLLNHLGRPSLYLGFFTTAWGLVSALTSLVTSFGGIVACRFILGIVEAPFFAGVLFYLSKWYTKEELNLRMSIFYSGSLISGAFGNLIAAGKYVSIYIRAVLTRDQESSAAWLVRAVSQPGNGFTSSKAPLPAPLALLSWSSYLTFRIPGNALRLRCSMSPTDVSLLTLQKPILTRQEA